MLVSNFERNELKKDVILGIEEIIGKRLSISFRNSVKWYESNRKNSGKEIAELILKKVEEIAQKPESRSADKDGIRWTSIL